MSSAYPDVPLLIDGAWKVGSGGRTVEVSNPATGQLLGTVAHAERMDLDAAIAAAASGFDLWRAISAFERSRILRRSAEVLRAQADEAARLLTLEQGKPLDEARAEILGSAEIIEWFAEEGRRAYGRIIPARSTGVLQMVVQEPVGPVAAFTPWNFPVHLSVRKLAAAFAAGCSVVLKGSEETPAACAAVARAFTEAGLPPGVLNLVFGNPAEISEHLITHPVIRKISFTGSTAVGKHLAGLAGQHMKPCTMELGGHAPVLVFADADIGRAVAIMCTQKFRNAGQICSAPSRFLIEQSVYPEFIERFSTAATAIRVGDGLDPETQMGPVSSERRLAAMEHLVSDATAKGATLHCGGARIGNRGCFFAPTVLGNVPLDADAMNEEPFGPIALFRPFEDFRSAVKEANRLAYGLAAYAFTGSGETAAMLGSVLQSGMVSINHFGLTLPETPFGGVKDSGLGSEGGSEAMKGYLVPKFITRMESVSQ